MLAHSAFDSWPPYFNLRVIADDFGVFACSVFDFTDCITLRTRVSFCLQTSARLSAVLWSVLLIWGFETKLIFGCRLFMRIVFQHRTASLLSSSSDNASNVDFWLITAVPRLPELLLLQLQDDVRGKHQVFLYFQLVEIMFGWGTQQFFCLKCTNLIQLYKMIKVLPVGQMYGKGHAQWRPLY